MRPLTNLERDNLIRRVAQSLAWSGLSTFERDVNLARAKVVVLDLEDTAVHGATAKRAAEAVLAGVSE